ncbi:MAG: Phosphatidylserine decarboxylase proenzyme [Phycisphaerae bacterium]|nr:Phosphatidylserine decarboxylase proenzyme [Phycisphaerae bacterium]
MDALDPRRDNAAVFAPYARVEVAGIVAGGGLLTAACALLAGAYWAVLPAALALALLSFYRDPPRRIPPDTDVLLAPADGRVVEVARGDPGGELRILIFLSVANVHVNRSPCAGRVLRVDYRPGQFLNALKAESTERNESNALTIEPDAPLPGPIVVRQIAGVLARRIVCATRPGDALQRGQRYGMIKLGSRTELRAADDGRWDLCVRAGQTVYGGVTVLARRKA